MTLIASVLHLSGNMKAGRLGLQLDNSQTVACCADPKKVKALAESISEIGLQEPV
jgi:hypothetical protein